MSKRSKKKSIARTAKVQTMVSQDIQAESVVAEKIEETKKTDTEIINAVEAAIQKAIQVRAVEEEATPVEETPVEEKPEEPVIEENPVEEEPAAEEPVIEETPVEEEPVVEEPVIEETLVEEEPVVEETPVIEEEPVVEDSMDEFADDQEYVERLKAREDELRWLYMELYENDSMYAELCDQMYRFHKERKALLKKLDSKRAKNPEWFKQNDMMGMMMYVDNFAGNLQGVKSKLDYITKCNVNYLHLMPLLETPEGRSDGGYAVSNFRKVQDKLGTMDDLAELADACHDRDISVCMDFVMNHTSEDHEWAMRAKQGDGEYMSRYFFYENYDIPAMYEKTVPQVFPTTAPGNFTYLPDLHHYVMTTFYPYQWDLNYKNPRVFNEMMYNFLFFANQGIDVIRIDAVPYIWKELGTNCRNLPKVHNIVRMMRIIGEIVCPGILLLGEVVMEPEKVVPYFGSVDRPECHMLYNVTTMATTWNSVATRDIRLLKRQMDTVSSLPKEYTFLNYLRCHDDIGWGLDYPTLEEWGMKQRPHKQFINDFFTGVIEDSFSRGELYNNDPVTGDARFCGTTASMCGIEKAGFENDEKAMKKAIKLDLMLHAYMLVQSGIPLLYSGDEVAQVNDYTYKDDPHKAVDSRYIHRGVFHWELADAIEQEGSVQNLLFEGLDKLEKARANEKVFMSTANTWTIDTYDDSVLCFGREYQGEKLVALFNFNENERMAWINEVDGLYEDLITGRRMQASGINMPGYGCYWLKRIEE